MTLSERMVEAAAIARYARFRASMAKAGYTLPPWERLLSEQQASALEDERAALTAALAVAEAEEPPQRARDAFGAYRTGECTYEECWAEICATLAGRVTL